ncbi:MAG: protocatechuate 3,4-dioxygenase [Pseudomonadota bacterium]
MVRTHSNNPAAKRATRRVALKGLAFTPIAALMPTRAFAKRTPFATEGPFYPTPKMRFADADNDLVKISGKVKEAGGEVVILKGRVFDRSGKPVTGARVEIWQCDATGRYLHTGDRRRAPRDPGFQGFGHVVTGSDGGYAFRTIKPVPYPGRTPHIHVKVFHGRQELTTQFYIAGHRQNARDWLYQNMTPSQRKAVGMVFTDGADGPQATVDVYL